MTIFEGFYILKYVEKNGFDKMERDIVYMTALDIIYTLIELDLPVTDKNIKKAAKYARKKL